MYSKEPGKIFYGLGIAGIGVLQLIYPGFRPVLLPVPAESTQHLSILVYAAGLALVGTGLYIAFAKRVSTAALLLGLALGLLFVFGHLPNRLMHQPGMLGAWTDAIKLLALSGGALMVARSFPGDSASGWLGVLNKLAPYGQYAFGLLLFLFGIDHFLYLDFVKNLVPAWIPGASFWTCLAGVALMGAGVSILIHFKPRFIGLLLMAMLLIWLVVLHIPRALVAPATDNGNEWTSVFQCLSFAGMALLWRDSDRSDG